MLHKVNVKLRKMLEIFEIRKKLCAHLYGVRLWIEMDICNLLITLFTKPCDILEILSPIRLIGVHEFKKNSIFEQDFCLLHAKLVLCDSPIHAMLSISSPMMKLQLSYVGGHYYPWTSSLDQLYTVKEEYFLKISVPYLSNIVLCVWK